MRKNQPKPSRVSAVDFVTPGAVSREQLAEALYHLRQALRRIESLHVVWTAEIRAEREGKRR